MEKCICEICGKEISKNEAANSSQKIRNKCPSLTSLSFSFIGNTQSPYLWDAWIHDFCDHCAEREFPSWESFEAYVQRKKVLEYVQMN